MSFKITILCKARLLMPLLVMNVLNLYAQNVGIGVPVPTSRLHINGDIGFAYETDAMIGVKTGPVGSPGNSLTIKAGNSATGNLGQYGGSLVLQAGNGFNENGIPNAGGNVIIRSGGNLLSAISGTYNPGNIIFQLGGANNAQENNWSEAMRIDYRGNVGIGIQADAQAKLDVAGKIKSIGFQMTNGAAAGSVLTSAADGTASWTPANLVESDPQVGNNALNYLSKWNGTDLSASSVYEINGKIGLGVANPFNRLDVRGTLAVGSYAGTYSGPPSGAIIEGRLGVGTFTPITQLDIAGGFKLGKEGTELTNIIKATVDLPARGFIANASSGVSYTVTGAALGGSVMVSPSSPLPSGLVIAFAFVSASGKVDVVFCNAIGVNINTAAIKLYITVVN